LLDAGVESLPLPLGWVHPDLVWLYDLRQRRMYLEQVSTADFTVLGRRYTLSTGDAPTHLRGLPRFYCIRDKVMWFWPVPAHNWQGGMSKEPSE